MTDIILSPVPLTDLLAHLREIVKEELKAKEQQQEERLLSPAEACKLFSPSVSKLTLSRWTADGLIQVQKIGGRLYYRLSDIIEAGTRLKKYKHQI